MAEAEDSMEVEVFMGVEGSMEEFE